MFSSLELKHDFHDVLVIFCTTEKTMKNSTECLGVKTCLLYFRVSTQLLLWKEPPLKARASVEGSPLF